MPAWGGCDSGEGLEVAECLAELRHGLQHRFAPILLFDIVNFLV
jgi:hypothetical protein